MDESLTSGAAYWEASAGCLQFSHLTLTGGWVGGRVHVGRLEWAEWLYGGVPSLTDSCAASTS